MQTSSEPVARPYQVLARKYRPQSFADLIGHEAMVRTLKNAFAADRIAHAYILTGVRGVGKTTTARILARALNYVDPEKPDDRRGPTIEMAGEGPHCRAIAESRHPDVMEMDAASRTGVNDVRELIEGVRYAPTEARYKVYIIDEVHMLSNQAFNALLKTLEEPPPHVKFIFATTEIRKLPVTVLSRCQRFDLRRIDPETLTEHLADIAEKEGARIDREALWMIARAGEGSVRDALSILDQAIASGAAGEAIDADQVRAMIGLADRARVWELMDAIFAGDARTALDGFSALYDEGAEPAVILRDMLDLAHLLSRVKVAGGEAAAHGPAGEAEAERARASADRLSLAGLTRAWALLMKGLEETNAAPDARAAGEMAIIRLCYASDLPTPDEALRMLKAGEGAAPPAPAAPSPAPERPAPPARDLRARPSQEPDNPDAPVIGSLEDLARLAGARRDAKLRTEIEAFARLVSLREGYLEIALEADAPADLAGRLTQALKAWTGRQWVVSLAAAGADAQTLREARLEEVMRDPLVKKVFEAFPDATIESIGDPATDEAAPAALAQERDAKTTER